LAVKWRQLPNYLKIFKLIITIKILQAHYI
jgi:hypothetical protein